MSSTTSSLDAAGVTVATSGVHADLTAGGEIRIRAGADLYRMQSRFSFPAAATGWHAFADQPENATPWMIRLTARSREQAQAAATGERYSVIRQISALPHRLQISDTFENTTSHDMGILIHHDIMCSSVPRQVLLGGTPRNSVGQTAENPSVVVELPASGLGIIAVDTLSRLQFEAKAGSAAEALDARCATISLAHFALRAASRFTFEWAIYPLGPGEDYFTFINRVRTDWNVNFPVQGPWSKFDTIGLWDVWNDPARLEAYLHRKRHGFITLSPWLDYDNFNARSGKTMERPEYRAHMRRAIGALKRAQPTIRCTGCMEGNLVSLPEDRMQEFFDALGPDERAQGIRPFNDKQMELIKSVPLRWKDCLLTGPDGRYTYEVYYPQPDKPLMAVAVYAAPDNEQFRYWMEQARFMMEDVGFDGVYIDQFSLAFHPNQRYTFDRWDGQTVDMDPRTGQITRRYTDGSLVGVEARRRLIEFVLSHENAVMVANTHSAAKEVQSAPISRFTEAEWFFNPLEWKEGTEPPALPELCRAHLSAPLALGYRTARLGEAGLRDYARVIMKSVIAYLRQGVLYYHFRTEIPASGPGSGEYGAINRMFPITPISLHKGWVQGAERTVTTVSGTYRWPQADAPACSRFDITGHPVAGGFSLRRAQPHGWDVTVNLADWAEVAVIEFVNARVR